MVLMRVAPALAAIMKDSSISTAAANYGITDSVANPFNGAKLCAFELFGWGRCESPMLWIQGTSIYRDSRARPLAS